MYKLKRVLLLELDYNFPLLLLNCSKICQTLKSLVLFVLWQEENRSGVHLGRNSVEKNIWLNGQKAEPRDQWKWASGAAGNQRNRHSTQTLQGASLSHNVQRARVRSFRVKKYVYRNIEDLGTPKLYKCSFHRKPAFIPSLLVIQKFGLGKIRNNKQTALAF